MRLDCLRLWSAPRLLATVLAASLAACGGGGENDITAGHTAAVEQESPVDELRAEAAPVSAADAAGAHFARLNEVRVKMGLAALRWNGSLAAAAQSHANYLAWNQASGHEEEPGAPGFTGASIADRAAAHGYRGKLPQETKAGGVSVSAQQGRERMDALLLAPLHRMQLLAPEFDDAGVGVVEGGGALVTDLGSSGGRIRTNLRRWMYPFNGQTGLETAFRPGTEVGLPDDLPAVTGTPLTLSGFLFSMITYSAASLVEEASNEEVPLVAQSKPGQMRASLIFFPARALKPDTAYVWRVTATVDRIAATSVARFVTAPAPVQVAQAEVPATPAE